MRSELNQLKIRYQNCTNCVLYNYRKQVVFGHGNPETPLMFVGINPGRSEDREGIPFCGPAGQLLSQSLRSIGISRQDVWITNVVKCKTPQNREPEPQETNMCLEILEQEIRIIKPYIIVAVGRYPFQILTGFEGPITQYNGKLLSTKTVQGIISLEPSKYITTIIHPAAALRSGQFRDQYDYSIRALCSNLETIGVLEKTF